MIIYKDKLDWIQLDITARCQAMCLECARNIEGKDINPNINTADTWDMPLEIFQKAVTPDMLKHSLKKIIFNGNFGDPCIHPKFIDICQYVVDHAHEDLKLNVSTNGAMFKPEHWTKVGAVLKNLKRHSVIFGIDGLSDTHHIYRRNTKYENIIDNAKAFIAAGGRANWQYIIFDHNKHQTEEAKQIAKEVGFKDIFFKGLKNTGGGARNFQKAVDKHKSGGIGAKTKKNDEVKLSVGSREGFKEAKKMVADMEYKKTTNYLDTAKISCQWYDTKGMYIEYDGTVWMCCWIGDMHKTLSTKPREDWSHIENKYGRTFHNLNYHSFDDILNHEFFASYLDKSFNSTRDDPITPRMHTCAKTCIWGKTFV